MSYLLKCFILILVCFSLTQAHAWTALWAEDIKCSNSSQPSVCLKKTYTKKVILQNRILKKDIPDWEKYINALDTYFEKYSNDRKKIENILYKIQGVQGKLWNSAKDKKIYEIIKYIEYKWNLVLLSIPEEKEEKIVLKNNEDIFNLTEKELETYLEGLTVQELEDIVNELYEGESEIYETVIELYDMQIQKARDTSRINDLKALQSAVEQVYQDTAEYPTESKFNELIGTYILRRPEDPLAWYTLNACDFWYKYEVGTDANGIRNANYRISTCFENTDYIKKRALNSVDKGDNDLRFEIWYWNENTVFTEDFYINGISSWKEYKETNSSTDGGNLDSLDEDSKRWIFYYVIYLKYIEENPELVDAYSRDARNAKISSDIRTLTAAFETRIAMEDIEFTDIVDHTSKKSHEHEIWTIYNWNINFTWLKQNGDDFKNPWEGYPYQVAYIESDFRGAKYRMYQFLWYKYIKENTYEIFLKWNYLKIDTTYPDSLFKNPNTWEYFKNGDTFIVK